MNKPLKLIRYNTGTDKKALADFKKEFDAIIINASIVAYSGASIADLVSMYNHRHIIDPMTHIFQQDMSAIISSNNKNNERKIKQSVKKYLDCLPDPLKNAVLQYLLPLEPTQIQLYLNDLASDVYDFETGYISKYIEKKEYDKYLQFAKIEPSAKIVIAPYFMLKMRYSDEEKKEWLYLNRELLLKTIEINQKKACIPVATQLVLDKKVLLDDGFPSLIRDIYNIQGYEYFFIWIDDFNSFEEKPEINRAYSLLIDSLNSIGKKPIMSYGGYESILLCSNDSRYKLFGVAQSVGYGEYRSVTPVGGGMPVNKYYFAPLHFRMKYSEVINVLAGQNYLASDGNPVELANRFYNNICDCKVCKRIISNDFNNFIRFGESKPYSINSKTGPIERNRPTSEALLIAALHFLYCKKREWQDVSQYDFMDLKNKLIEAYEQYLPEKADAIKQWCDIYE